MQNGEQCIWSSNVMIVSCVSQTVEVPQGKVGKFEIEQFTLGLFDSYHLFIR